MNDWWYTFENILIFIFSDENEIRVKTTIENQSTWERNHRFTSLMLVNKDQPVKDNLYTSNIHYL